MRPAQYVWGFIKLGGPFFGGPPYDLHTICGACTNMKKFGGLVFGGPPSIPHNIYSNLCDSEVRPTWDFIILNKSRTRPPRHKEANESHARHGAQNFSPISVPSPRFFCVLCVCVCVCVCLFVCLFACLLVFLFASVLALAMFACLFVCLIVCWVASLLLCLFGWLFVCSSHWLFVCLADTHLEQLVENTPVEAKEPKLYQTHNFYNGK